MVVMLNSNQVRAWMNGFYGYGNPQGQYWFVGMEEGGGGWEDEIQARLNTWLALGQPQFMDLAEFHQHSIMNGPSLYSQKDRPARFFDLPRPKLQRTWMALSRFTLSAEASQRKLPDDPSIEQVGLHQATELGRLDRQTLLTELLPSPSTNDDDWIYSDLPGLGELQGRRRYKEWLAPVRVKALREMIDHYRPRSVVFYSVDPWYLQWWFQIAGVTCDEFVEVSSSGIHVAKRDGTIYMVIAHPNGRGVTNDYFLEAGRIMDQEVRSAGAQPNIYSQRQNSISRDRSLYHRFWQKLNAAQSGPPTLLTKFSRHTPQASGIVAVDDSSLYPTTRFLYGISIVGRWAVSQFNVPMSNRRIAEELRLQTLSTKLINLPIYSPNGPFMNQVGIERGKAVLYIKQEFRGEVIHESTWLALQPDMIAAMKDLENEIRPYI